MFDYYLTYHSIDDTPIFWISLSIAVIAGCFMLIGFLAGVSVHTHVIKDNPVSEKVREKLSSF